MIFEPNVKLDGIIAIACDLGYQPNNSINGRLRYGHRHSFISEGSAAALRFYMSDFQNFLTKAVDFYLTAPQFFNWAAPIIVGAIAGTIWLAYWLGGKFADAEINGLKAQVAALDQRFSLAKEQTVVSMKEATDSKGQLEKLRQEINNRAPIETLQNSSKVLDANLNRVLSANTAASEILGYISTGFDDRGQLKWRPIRPDEERLLRK